jgi:hypothetical protein
MHSLGEIDLGPKKMEWVFPHAAWNFLEELLLKIYIYFRNLDKLK